ncbi:uncharacterized protein HMPREF1541_01666 [Cyphellophora europaea CBS 101466]|uniref:Uncharacterized protein n=1 Tax=Cyphellophora europaea (strain CBS 101466) TaxID=1220924 RepID=W2S3J5_CYPE1|nr:uncharacterized protein HMPREF1541_01666 [Cyphellophora europaea CBS 101466]ETN42509.1 hypothetical protein HMPREF1541_01666 [Cyphellophora europaea CBS 101466]
MTSLIFGAVYLTHQAVVGHRHEKKRVKNYERWEGLRDEYDEQRKTQRQTRSLDLSREDNNGILTLRDQQEANDARTSWRPQEAWNDAPVSQQPTRQSMDTVRNYNYGLTGQPHPRPQEHRSISLANGYSASANNSPPPQALAPQQTGFHGVGPMRATPTGAAWDDGLPPPLAVPKRNEQPAPTGSRGVSRSTSLRQVSSAASSQHHLPGSSDRTPPQMSASMSESQPAEDKTANINNPFAAGNRFDTQRPIQTNSTQQLPREPEAFGTNNPFEQQQPSFNAAAFPSSSAAVPPSNNPFEAHNRFDQPRRSASLDMPRPTAGTTSNNPFEGFANHGAPMAPIKEMKTPAGERDMMEWWK